MPNWFASAISGPTTPLASPHDARMVQVAELSTRTVSTIGYEEHLVLTAQERRSSNMRRSLNGVPPRR